MQNTNAQPFTPPKCSVGIIGGSGAGKTVFLAAMHHLLSTQRPETGFFISASRDQERILLDMFSGLSIKRKWIDETRTYDISEWIFTVKVTFNRREWDACVFHYYDYAGGLITDNNTGNEKQQKVIDEKLSKCDVIIGMLDGEKIRHVIQRSGLEQKRIFLSKDIPSIIAQMKRALETGTVKALHFVVTKWDYVEACGLEFLDVRKMLLDDPVFGGFVNSMEGVDEEGNAISIRLIPVSSVGFKFVKSHDEKFGMVIDDQETPKPWYVAMPFACSIPDVIAYDLRKLEQETGNENFIPNKSSSWLTLLSRTARAFIRYFAESKWLTDGMKDILDNIGRGFEDYIKSGEDDRYKDFLSRKNETLSKVSSKKTAYEHAINVFAMLQRELDARFTSNKLN